MVELLKKNISDIEKEYHQDIEELCEQKKEFYDNLFKKYEKPLTIEIIFDHSSALYKISASIDLKSKKLLLVEEGKKVMPVLTKLCNEFKKAVKRQYELEKKDYIYKRKR